MTTFYHGVQQISIGHLKHILWEFDCLLRTLLSRVPQYVWIHVVCIHLQAPLQGTTTVHPCRKQADRVVVGFRCSLPPANEVCEGYVFTGVCLSTGRGRGCMHPGGLHLEGGPGASASRVGLGRPPHRILWDRVNKRAVRILLECILVNYTHGPATFSLLQS